MDSINYLVLKDNLQPKCDSTDGTDYEFNKHLAERCGTESICPNRSSASDCHVCVNGNAEAKHRKRMGTGGHVMATDYC